MGATQKRPSSYYDPELEERRLDFQVRRYEEEKAERQRRVYSEAAEQRRRDERAAEERHRQLAIQMAVSKTQQGLLELQKTEESRERESRASVASQLKFYGYILKNVGLNFQQTTLTFRCSSRVLRHCMKELTFQMLFVQNYCYRI